MKNNYESLTQSQSLLWIGQEMNPDAPMYNMVMTYELKVQISIEHFQMAFRELIYRYDALRSVFVVKETIPSQVFLEDHTQELEIIDFSNEENPHHSYKNWEKNRITKRFDVSVCLLDSALIKLDKSHYVWYINQHHLITDAWSNSILFATITQLYKNYKNNVSVSRIQNDASYKTYIEKERSERILQKNDTSKTYWANKINNCPPSPNLYANSQKNLSTASTRLYVNLGLERSKKLRALANEKGIRVWTEHLSLYNIFLTILFAYLYRVSGQEQLAIGSPTHNRTSKKIKETVGYFVEVFPLFMSIDIEETFLSLVQKIQLESNNFLKHAKPGISTSDMHRSFHVLFNYIHADYTDFDGVPVHSEWVHPGHHDPRQHIRLHVHDLHNTGEIQLYFDLNNSVFDTEQQRLEVTQHFLNVLDAFIEDKNQGIKDISLITKSEISRIKTWNTTTTQYAQNETLLSKFESQVVQTPDAVAIVFENTSLTYAELHHKSNQVAHFLIQEGIKKNDLIAVSLERSFEMMIYIYGILKAGAAYLPVDTQTPIERLHFILNDANAKFLFYNHNNINDHILKGIDCFHVTLLHNTILSFDDTSPQVRIEPEDLAYVIYTSGSTGEPKGVVSHHKGICNRLNWMNDDYPLSQNDILIQKTPITFDVSLWELFWALQVGAKLVIEVPEGHKDPDKLIKTIQENNVSVIHFVPSMLTIFSQTDGIEACTSIKNIFCSGEALSVTTVEKVYQKLSKVEIYNLYGPTEASVDVTSWHCKKEEIFKGIPIGKPVANTKLYILDHKLQQLPIGVPGELYIAGVQVAKGYLNRKKLTNDRFLKNPFSNHPNATMYKTGDLVRYRSDGNIEYLGRTDHQVKIRGLRIELGEIEKIIESHNAISQAIVTVAANDNLVAYYVGQKLEDIEIASMLENKLPVYMIPSFYIYLDHFEFLSSGKVNRKRLPEFDSTTKSKRTKTQKAPQNEIEQIILDIWIDVLKIDNIGVNENFIQIGGNSLNAISITSRLRAALEIEMSITDVFNYPTIIAYAEYVETVISKLLNE